MVASLNISNTINNVFNIVFIALGDSVAIIVGQLGRKIGSTKSVDKKKEEYKEVIKLLRQSLSVRKVAKLTDVSASTVQRLKKEFGL